MNGEMIEPVHMECENQEAANRPEMNRCYQYVQLPQTLDENVK